MKLNSSTYRITAITLALLMFFTSIGYTVDMHYCQGQLKTFNFFGKAKSCHEIGQGMQNCPHHKKMMKVGHSKNTTVNKKSCCSNKTIHIQANQEVQNQVDNTVVVRSKLQQFVIAFVAVFINPIISNTEDTNYTDYKSPLIPRDIYVLFQTYLL